MKKYLLLMTLAILTSCSTTSKKANQSEIFSPDPKKTFVTKYEDENSNMLESISLEKICSEEDFKILKNIPKWNMELLYAYYLETYEENLNLLLGMKLEVKLIQNEMEYNDFALQMNKLLESVETHKSKKSTIGDQIVIANQSLETVSDCIPQFKESLNDYDKAKYFIFIDDPFTFLGNLKVYGRIEYIMNRNFYHFHDLFKHFMNSIENKEFASQEDAEKAAIELIGSIKEMRLSEYLESSQMNYDYLAMYYKRTIDFKP